MIGFAVLFVSLLVVGFALMTWLWRRVDGPAALEETFPAERLVAGALAGTSLWLAGSWALALTHHLERLPLLVFAAVFIGAAAVILISAIRRDAVGRFPAGVWIVAAIPIAAWVAYILWRSTLLPPDNHDAVSYHFPKAVFMIRAHGFRYFETPDARINTLPCNYELLLSDLLLLSGSDKISEWISTISYLLFLAASAAVAQRWWGRGRHVIAVVIATAITPVLLLNSGADKNDLMTCFFAVCALLWAGRWYSRGGYIPWILTIVALTVGAGTKPHVAGILIGILPFLVARLITRMRMRQIGVSFFAVTLLACVVCFSLCGGAVYVFDVVHAMRSGIALDYPGAEHGIAKYGDWENMWKFPVLQFIAPFSSNQSAVWVPWKHEYWFWPRYEIFFSNYGELFSILILALPFCVHRYRRSVAEVVRRERLLFCAGAVIAFLLTMPVVMRPLGFFAGHGRYVAFVIPAVLCWTVAPLVREAEAASPRTAILAVIALALMFVSVAPNYAENDRFSPWDYVRYAARRHGTRRIWFSSERAGSIVDQIAGPRDAIAVDGTFDIWMYPAMGAGLTRPIEFVPPGPGPVRIPADARWVIVDRSWHVVWGSPAFTDMGGFWRYIGTGRPAPEDLRVIRALWGDPAFQLVYYDSRLTQAVFRRR